MRCGARAKGPTVAQPRAGGGAAPRRLESAAVNIAVCVKQVPEGASRRLDPASKRLDRSGQGALNSFDAHAIEEALRLRDASGGGEVVLVSLGPANVQDALRKGLAMGADRSV